MGKVESEEEKTSPLKVDAKSKQIRRKEAKAKKKELKASLKLSDGSDIDVKKVKEKDKKKKKEKLVESVKQSPGESESKKVSKKKFKTKKERVKKKKKGVRDSAEDVDLTLDLIKELGGDESDINLLSEIKDTDGNDEEFGQDKATDLKNLIESLGFSKANKKAFVVKDTDYPEKDQEVMSDEEPEEDDDDEDIQDSEITSTTPDAERSPTPDEEPENEEEEKKTNFHFVKDIPDRNYSIIKTGEKWTELISNDLEQQDDSSFSKYWVPKLEKYTKAVWELDIENYKKASSKGSKKSETQWINTVLKSGTLNDKMSAYVVLLQDSPIHNLAVLETLISMVSLKSRRPCLLAIDTLQKLFLDELLVEDRKLRTFDKNPFASLPQLTGGNKDTRDRYLLTWLFEDRLKALYDKFIAALDDVAKDTVEKSKIRSMTCVFELLSGNPEQEQGLLARLVNKLGDPTRAIAAKAMYQLGQLLERHPMMKHVVVSEVERLLYRPNISPKAQYYGICFLSQILLDQLQGDNLAGKLIGIYFSFFKLSISKGEVDTKLMSALLTGVNRAFPFASIEGEQLDQQMETMHKLVHVVGFNTAIQALTLLYQVMDSKEAVTDRFYSALYRKILDPALPTSSKQAMFLNLLFKSMKKDQCISRIKAFIKRLFQVCEYQPSHVICGILFLISEVLSSRKELSTIQDVLLSQTTSVVNLEKFEDDSDGEEHFEDVPDEDVGGGKEDEEKKVVKEEDKEVGWVHRAKNVGGHDRRNEYDPQGRNPLYCGAETAALWELESLSAHFHPTVALFAGNLLKSEQIKYGGDPLSDFTVGRFLDRFVFRNPKKDPGKNKPTTVLGKRNVYRPKGIKAIAPDSKDFINRDIESVPGDEIFMYKYFKNKAERMGIKEEDEDVQSVTSEEFNNFLDTFNEREKDFDDEEVDFAGGVKEKEKKKGGDEDDDESDVDMDVGEEDNSEDSEPEGLDGEDDDVPGFENLDDMESDDEDGEMEQEDIDIEKEMVYDDDDDEFDEEGFGEEGFGSDDDNSDSTDQAVEVKVGKKKDQKKKEMAPVVKKKKMKFPKFDPNDLGSLLADAEEFAHLIDENDDTGGTHSMANPDKASAKQLKWESKRDDFMSGKDWKKKGKGEGKKFSKGPGFNKRGGKKDFRSSKSKRK